VRTPSSFVFRPRDANPLGVEPLVIVGAGGHGRVVLDAALASGLQVAGFVADPVQGPVNGIAFLGPTAMLDELHDTHRFIVAIGDQQARRELSLRLAGRLQSVIHPTAWVSRTARIGQGTAVIGGVIVNANADVGDFCILNTACSVDHDCRPDGVQLCPGARLAGNVSCREDAFIGTGAVVIPGVHIGVRATVGAGAVIVRDISDDSKVSGDASN